MGIYFSKTPVQKRLFFFPVFNNRFKIPPGQAAAEVTQELTIPFLLDMEAIAVAPHMHLLGRKIKLEMEGRNGTTPLIYIDDWDFNWQGFYEFTEPVRFPALSKLRLTCTYDNTENNPRNPSNPLKTVGWGEGTEDEMCLGFFGVTLDNQDLARFLPFQRGRTAKQ
jgi:hypothetical protein